MDDTKLRNLEKHYKLRVKTGCDTCRYVGITKHTYSVNLCSSDDAKDTKTQMRRNKTGMLALYQNRTKM
jgi:hypothetical protein